MENSLKKYMSGGADFDKTEFECPPSVLCPTYAWLWTGKIKKSRIENQLDSMLEAGIKSLYILPLPENFSPGKFATTLEPEYLSDSFFELVRFAAECARSRGMSLWIYDEGGWPSGMACGKVVEKSPELVAKKLVKTDNGYTLAPRYYPFMLEKNVPHYADSASDKANDVFIDLTYKPYREKLGDLFGTFVPIIFTDEPAIRYPALPDGAAELFRERYGQDINEILPDLFSDTPDGAQNRINYCKIVTELFGRRYFTKIHDWCKQNGIYFSGHLNMDNTLQGSHMNHYGSQVDMLRKFDIPGIDVIWRQIYPFSDSKSTTGEYDNIRDCSFFPRFASSAAHLNGTNLAVSESIGIYGHGVSADIIRFVCNYQYIRGINLINLMSIPYEREGNVPFVMAPQFFSERPDYTHLTQINGYLARMTYLTTLGRNCSDTALVCPVEDVYALGDREKRALDSFEKAGSMLERAKVDFDIIDYNAIKEAKVVGGTLCINGACYKSVIIPEGIYLDPDLRQKLLSVSSKILPAIDCNADGITVMRRRLENGKFIWFLFNSKTTDMTIDTGLDFDLCRLDCKDGSVRKVDPHKLFIASGDIAALMQYDVPDVHTNYTDFKTLDGFECEYVSQLTLSPDGISKIDIHKKSVGADFSGVARYTKILNVAEPKNACITFEKLSYSAKVFVNGKEAGVTSLAPYSVEIPENMWIPGENTLDIYVANTPANAYSNFDAAQYFEPRFLGAYNDIQREFEKDSLDLPGFSGARIGYEA